MEQLMMAREEVGEGWNRWGRTIILLSCGCGGRFILSITTSAA